MKETLKNSLQSISQHYRFTAKKGWLGSRDRKKKALKWSCNQINTNASLTRISSKREKMILMLKGCGQEAYSHLCQYLGPLKTCFFSAFLFLYVVFKAVQYIYLRAFICYTDIYILRTRSSSILKQFWGIHLLNLVIYTQTHTYKKTHVSNRDGKELPWKCFQEWDLPHLI